ncbi:MULTISPECIES: hypothetical protein [Sphingobacterium]
MYTAEIPAHRQVAGMQDDQRGNRPVELYTEVKFKHPYSQQ